MDLVLTSILLGVGLAMDACSVSMANGLKEPKMNVKKVILISMMFALFQALMPLIGYFIGSMLLSYIEKYIPWIALILLGFVGGKMFIEGLKHQEEEVDGKSLTFIVLLVQAIATSIDALSVGFSIADYKVHEALISALIIAIVTFAICIAGVYIGKKFGTALGSKAEMIGGIILIIIGLEIFITGII